MFHATNKAPQLTLAAPLTYSGTAPFDGRTLTARILPGEPDSGIVFVRTDVARKHAIIPVQWAYASTSSYCMGAGNAHGVTVTYIENVLVPLQQHRIDNAVIELSSHHVPAPDGGAAALGAIIERTGIARQWVPSPG